LLKKQVLEKELKNRAENPGHTVRDFSLSLRKRKRHVSCFLFSPRGEEKDLVFPNVALF